MSDPLRPEHLARALNTLVPAGADDADLYLQHSTTESLSLEEGRVKHVSASTSQGIGARVVKGEVSGHAYTDRLELSALLEAARAARTIADDRGQRTPVNIASGHGPKALYAAVNPAQGVAMRERRALLEHVDRFARELDKRVVQVFAGLACSHTDVRIVRMDGSELRDVR
ncbi:MAG TPA: DNA gyrase modulator, partial [Mariprofundaceae bacterium]|nr:DNA gyrase modulator [Mariprofundaceae bacterium]